MPYKDPDYMKKWRKANPEYASKWRKANPGKGSIAVKAYMKRLRAKALKILGNKYSKCPFSDQRALQIDHINGGGRAEFKVLGRTNTYLLNVINSVTRGEKRYQILCANCNWIKRVENREGYIKKNV